jgi:hypothetical protein
MTRIRFDDPCSGNRYPPSIRESCRVRLTVFPVKYDTTGTIRLPQWDRRQPSPTPLLHTDSSAHTLRTSTGEPRVVLIDVGQAPQSPKLTLFSLEP